MQCKLRARCPVKSDPLYNCWDDECDGWTHEKCSEMLLVRYNIDVAARPSTEERNSADEPVVFCKKGCYLKWLAAGKRKAKEEAKAATAPKKTRKVSWETDGSLDVLMEWITTEGNYAEYCGANNNRGKSKTQYHKELALLIKEKKPESDRTDKDVENKITSLERQFRVASDWANNTGAGVDKPGDFQAAVLQRCPLYNELEPIMGDRPNAKPLASNEDPDIEENAPVGPAGVAPTAVAQSIMNNESDSDSSEQPKKTPPKSTTSTTSSITKSTSSSSKRRVTTADTAPKKKRTSNTNVDDLLSSYLKDDEEGEEANNNSFKQLRVREVIAKESEAHARMLEAEAVSGKHKCESELLNIQAKAELLRQRKKLAEEGINQADIDALLPLNKSID
jgi:hypothetical protein